MNQVKWYENTYKVFNKKYEPKKNKIKKNKKNLIEKIKTKIF